MGTQLNRRVSISDSVPASTPPNVSNWVRIIWGMGIGLCSLYWGPQLADSVAKTKAPAEFRPFNFLRVFRLLQWVMLVSQFGTARGSQHLRNGSRLLTVCGTIDCSAVDSATPVVPQGCGTFPWLAASMSRSEVSTYVDARIPGLLGGVDCSAITTGTSSCSDLWTGLDCCVASSPNNMVFGIPVR